MVLENPQSVFEVIGRLNQRDNKDKMIKTFKEAVTRKQRDELVGASVKALTELVGLPERKDILKEIEICSHTDTAPRHGGGGVWAKHKEAVCLTRDGLEKIGSCEGHSEGGGLWSSSVDYVKCGYEGSKMTIRKSQYLNIVEEYEITPDQISQIKERITRG